MVPSSGQNGHSDYVVKFIKSYKTQNTIVAQHPLGVSRVNIKIHLYCLFARLQNYKELLS